MRAEHDGFATQGGIGAFDQADDVGGCPAAAFLQHHAHFNANVAQKSGDRPQVVVDGCLQGRRARQFFQHVEKGLGNSRFPKRFFDQPRYTAFHGDARQDGASQLGPVML